MRDNKTPVFAKIESLSHDGRGVAHLDGKTIFIENALPDEEVNFVYIRRHKKFDEGKAVEILKSSPDRTAPKCEHFNMCGGCSMQHVDHTKQISLKTKIFEEHIKHDCGFKKLKILPPITGPVWGYRSRARLSVRYVEKKQKVLVGFHEKNGRYVAEIESCHVLHPAVGEKIQALRELVTDLSIYNQIPQIEASCGNNKTVLLFRHLQDFSIDDLNLLEKFASVHDFEIYLQPGGPDTVNPLAKNSTPLTYKHPKHEIEMHFDPTDFTQINQEINEQMASLIVELLELEADDDVLDLFCGIGNFTLPIAKKCNKIIGVEGSASAIIRAKQNAEHNNINNAEFYCADLAKELAPLPWTQKKYDKILLDPPRTGALEICSKIKKFGAKKIVYVSCNHTTLARDAKELADKGYKLQNARVADMFPHTKHMEIVSVFVKK